MKALERVTAVLDARGCRRDGADWRCPAHEDAHASLSVSQGDRGVLVHCHAGCTPEQVVEALGMKLVDLFDVKRRSSRGNGSGGRIVATYDYVDADGELAYQVVRFDPKDFRQRRPDGNGGWLWNL